MTKKGNRFLAELKKYRLNLKTLLMFELIYRLIGIFIVSPVIVGILNATLSFTQINYIGDSNAAELFLHPFMIFVSFIAILIVVFFIVLEFSALIILFNESRLNNKVCLIPLVAKASQKALYLYKPKNWLMIFFVLVTIPLTNFGLLSSYLPPVQIPGFIMSFINENNLYYFLFAAISIAAFYLIMRLFFVFNYFILEKKSFIQSCKASFSLSNKNCIRIGTTYLAASVITLSLILLIVLSMVAILYLAQSFNVADLLKTELTFPYATITALSLIAVLSSLVFSLATLASTPILLGFISACYYAFSKEKGLTTNNQIISEKDTHIGEKLLTKKRKVILSSLAFLCLFALKFFMIHQFFSIDTDSITTGDTSITAHRGNSSEAPENTKAALEQAIEAGADYVEFDVCQTKDGVVVVSHDNNLKRLTGENIDIWDSTYDEIKDLDIGSWFSSEYSNQRIMTLDEAITLCKGKIQMNIELKPTIHDTNFTENCVGIFQKHNLYDEAFIASLDLPTLIHVKELDSKIKTCYNTFIALGNVQLLPVDIFSIEMSFVNAGIVNKIHSSGKELLVWTIDETSDANALLELNIDSIITDLPKTMIDVNNNFIKTEETPLENLFLTFFIGFDKYPSSSILASSLK